jgi:3-hydroxybutyryl-CoA dehydrogenase
VLATTSSWRSSSDAAATAGMARLKASLERAAARGKIDSSSEVLARIRVTTDREELADRDLVVEAILEDEAAKVALFKRLDKVIDSPDAILASNTSSSPIMKLAVATGRPAQVIGIHFLNPVLVLPLVGLVPSLLTASDTTERARTFGQTLSASARFRTVQASSSMPC